ncbi:MFS transporter [Streptomyces sp. NPDC001663]|uniref:MFS transporter n=1 Tax=Streptomyces sp. NPDC001663 TaxID=3364597 RepID=UPI003693E75F
MVFAGTAVNYLDRANLSIALPYMKDDLHLSGTASGLLLGAFSLTYALMQFPAGWLVDKLGPRRLYGYALIAWSIATMLVGAATGLLVLVLLRMLLGVAESPAYPSSAKIVSRWFPVRERGIAASIFDSGARMGSAVSLPLITGVIAWLGWRGAFVAAGVVGLVFGVFWLRFYRDPEDHPKLSAEELAYIQADNKAAEKTDSHAEEKTDEPAGSRDAREPESWIALFRHRATWGMMLGFFCLSFVLYFFITWFPSYLVDERGFDLLKLGFYGMIPALVAMPAEWLGGLLQGRLIARGRSVNFARKVPLVSGLLLASVIVFAGSAPNAATALVLLTVSYSALTFAASSLWAMPSDIAPTPGNVASLAGIQGFGSNFAGFLSPIVVGALLDAGDGSYGVPLTVAGAVSIAGALVYGLVLGRIQPLGSAR